MPNRRTSAHLLLVLLFLLVQGMVLAHGISHGFEATDDGHVPTCSLCVAGHGLGAALPSLAVDFSAPPATGEVILAAVAALPDSSRLTPRQRGPPQLS